MKIHQSFSILTLGCALWLGGLTAAVGQTPAPLTEIEAEEEEIEEEIEDGLPLSEDGIDDAETGENTGNIAEGQTLSIDGLLLQSDSTAMAGFPSWARPKVVAGCDTTQLAGDYTDDEYKARLQKIAAVIEMPYNSIVKSYIDLYAKRRKQLVGAMLGVKDYYFPLFEQACEAEGIPLELKYLPVIESALNPNAVSPAGAAGLWQFMVATGRLYGLKVNTLVDERRDPLKASAAGARYLHDLYKIYNDWPLAIAAYNCGPGNVNKAIRRAGGKKDYWAIYYFLPKETRGYVPAFIAANYVMNYYGLHDICPLECPPVLQGDGDAVASDAMRLGIHIDTVRVSKRIHLGQIADLTGMSIEDLRLLNPQYRRDVIPGDTEKCTLILPYDMAEDFVELQDTISRHKVAQYGTALRTEVKPSGTPSSSYSTGSGNKIYYKVKSGETLSRIAARYGVTLTNLKRWNNLKSNTIRAGQRLIIYTKRAPSSSSAGTSSSSSYKVRSGDTLYSIAKKYGVTVSALQRANGKSNTNIKVGEWLKIPKK